MYFIFVNKIKCTLYYIAEINLYKSCLLAIWLIKNIPAVDNHGKKQKMMIRM